MSRVSNVNRKATAKAFIEAVKLLRRLAGITIQSHRSYESPSRGGEGLKQNDVATSANTSQATVSNLETGKSIPADPILRAILDAAGFNMAAGGGGRALLEVLQAIRDNETGLAEIEREQPR